METYIRYPSKECVDEATKALDHMYNPDVHREAQAAKDAIESARKQIQGNLELMAELPKRNEELAASIERIQNQYMPALIKHGGDLAGHKPVKFALVVKYNDSSVRYLVERWMLDPASIGKPAIPAEHSYETDKQVGPASFPQTAEDVYDLRKYQDYGAWTMPDPETPEKYGWTEVTYKQHGQKAKQVATDIARKWAPERTFFLDKTTKRDGNWKFMG
jgi:hypothetical protein